MRWIRLAALALVASAVAGYVLHAEFNVEAAPSAQAGRTRASTVQTGVAVRVAVIGTKDVAATTSAFGWVEPVATVDVRPQIAGAIVAQPVGEGQMVKAGDLLFSLDDRAIRAAIAGDQATIAKDQAILDQAKADLDRDKTLAVGRLAVTQQQVDQQQALMNSDAAQVEMDRAALQADQVQLSYMSIRAPIDGKVGAINRTLGNYVQPTDQDPLVTITQMAPVRVTFSIPERDLAAFRSALASGQDVAVEATVAGAQAPAAGKLSFINPSVDTASGTVVAKAEFENADGALWPGQYVDVTVRLGAPRSAVVAPLVAVQQGDSGPFVFRVGPDRAVGRQDVTLGQTSGSDVVITSGLAPGDHVVVDGQLRLTPGAKVVETVVSDAASG